MQLTAKERANIKVLKRRHSFLDKKIQEKDGSEEAIGFSRWERRALKWVLNLVENNDAQRN